MVTHMLDFRVAFDWCEAHLPYPQTVAVCSFSNLHGKQTGKNHSHWRSCCYVTMTSLHSSNHVVQNLSQMVDEYASLHVSQQEKKAKE